PPARLHPLSLHDALPISPRPVVPAGSRAPRGRVRLSPKSATDVRRNPVEAFACLAFAIDLKGHFLNHQFKVLVASAQRAIIARRDRKSTRLHSSHVKMSY